MLDQWHAPTVEVSVFFRQRFRQQCRLKALNVLPPSIEYSGYSVRPHGSRTRFRSCVERDIS
eukprot:5241943-Prymnesium_polylepis.1